MSKRRTATSATIALLAVTVPLLLAAKRRSVSPVPCNPPTVALSIYPPSPCPADVVTLYWAASDSHARVFIDGVAGPQQAIGSRTYQSGQRTFAAKAELSCAGPRSTLSVTTTRPNINVSFGKSAVALTSTAPVSVQTDDDATLWTLSTSLGTVSPSSGNGTKNAIYTSGSAAGSERLVATATGRCGATNAASAGIYLDASLTTDNPPPGGTGGHLRCCDGTFSPTCTSCANKQGCCSSHGGVCASCP